MRAELDTNIFVSMTLGGYVGKINDQWRAGKFTIVVSDDTISEYLDVLQGPKLRPPARTIAIIVNRIYRKAEFVTPAEQITTVELDPTDNKFLEAAIAGKVDSIVSGDSHLLDLKQFHSIPIMTAREFIDWPEENT